MISFPEVEVTNFARDRKLFSFGLHLYYGKMKLFICYYYYAYYLLYLLFNFLSPTNEYLINFIIKSFYNILLKFFYNNLYILQMKVVMLLSKRI